MPGPNGVETIETRAGDGVHHQALCGRAAQCEDLGQLIANVQAGRSRVLVVRGR